jgi:hypothetical protein
MQVAFLLCATGDISEWRLQTMCAGGARYFEVRLLLENNALSNKGNISWELFTRHD